jgi:hypothetical protein
MHRLEARSSKLKAKKRTYAYNPGYTIEKYSPKGLSLENWFLQADRHIRQGGEHLSFI